MNRAILKIYVGPAFAFLAAMGALASTASAAPIYTPPSGTTTVRCTTGLTTSTTLGPTAGPQSCGGSAFWHDISDASPGTTTVSTSGTNDGPLGLGGFPASNSSFASLSYYINLVNPGFEPGVFTVPLLIDATVQGFVTGGGFLNADDAVAQVRITDPFNNQLFYTEVDCSALSCPVNTVQTTAESIDVQILNPFTQLLVTMSAFAQYGSNAPSSVSAMADPFIRIDPNFLAAHPGYSLVFSDNVNNGSGDTTPPATNVPEPTSMLLMCMGLLVSGFTMRRRAAR